MDRKKPNQSSSKNHEHGEPKARTLALCLYIYNANGLDWQLFIPINIVTLIFVDLFKESTPNTSSNISEIRT